MGGLSRLFGNKPMEEFPVWIKTLTARWRVQCRWGVLGKAEGMRRKCGWVFEESSKAHTFAHCTYFLWWHFIFIFLQGWVVQKTSSPVQMADVFHGPWLAMGKRIVKMAQMNHRSAKFSEVLNLVTNWGRKIWAIWNLANIQPSWPRAWSIMYTYWATVERQILSWRQINSN